MKKAMDGRDTFNLNFAQENPFSYIRLVYDCLVLTSLPNNRSRSYVRVFYAKIPSNMAFGDLGHNKHAKLYFATH